MALESSVMRGRARPWRENPTAADVTRALTIFRDARRRARRPRASAATRARETRARDASSEARAARRRGGRARGREREETFASAGDAGFESRAR